MNMRCGIRRIAVLAGLALCIPLFAAPAFAEKRVALVVGNNAYANLPSGMQLRNAISDARAVRDTLKGLGFDVLYSENVDRKTLVDRLSDFTARLSAGDLAFFFFAGHGVSFSGANFLLPSDVPVPRGSGRAEEGRLADQAVAETQIIERITGAGARVAIVVIDACRDNPLQASDRRSLGSSRGLVPNAPARGVFSIYSAGFGQAALDRLGPDDRNPNSVFTRVFVEKLKAPGLDLKVVATETRRGVAALAEKVGHEQFPAYYDQIVGGDIYLAGLPQASAPPAVDVSKAAAENAKAAEEKRVLEQRAQEQRLQEQRAQQQREQAEQDRRKVEEARKKEETDRLKVAVAPPPVRPATPDPVKPAVGVFPPPASAQALTPEQERALAPMATFRECDVCPEMIVVPSGTFTMGSPASEPGRDSDESPQRKVTFARPFAAGKYAVTFDEWDACVADGGCDGYRPGDNNFGRGRRPAINISWKRAQSYVAWLSKKTGQRYRLLSEAEREYIARAGSTGPYWFGGGINANDDANYDDRSVKADVMTGLYRDQTVPVDSFKPNPWGFFQVHGNVMEWVEDCWNANYRGAPVDGSAWIKGNCKQRAMRGGSWNDFWYSLRSANRFTQEIDVGMYLYGLRVARTLAP